VPHEPAGVGVHQHRIDRRDDAVHRNGIAALLEIEVAADRVREDEARLEHRIQPRDRLMKPELVEAALLVVGHAALEVFQRAGDGRLAMSLHHGQVDDEIGLGRLVADRDRESAACGIALP
jgi:hypothetical protein